MASPPGRRHDAVGDFIDVGEGADCDLGRARRRVERKRIRLGLDVRSPVPDAKRVLRRSGDRLAGDDILARNGAGADLDPKLPVGVGIAEGQVIALDAVDHPVADMLGVDDVGASVPRRRATKQVGAGAATPNSSAAGRSADRGARRIELRIGVEVPAVQAERLAVGESSISL